MDPYVLDPENTVKFLAIISAIPAVVFALWADYYGRILDGMIAEKVELDPAAETYRIRCASLLATGFLLVLFLATHEVRETHPIFGNFSWLMAILSVSWVQSGLERKVRKTTAKPIERAQLASWSFFWALVAGSLQAFSMIAPLLIVALIAPFAKTHFGSSDETLVGWMVAGSLVGGLTGFVVNFGLGSFYLRRMFSAKPLENSEKAALLEDCMKTASLPKIDFFVLETENFGSHNAMVAGFKNGKGFFRPGLFISRGVLDGLSAGELRAVILHEASHLRLAHLRKRVQFSFSLMVATLTGSVLFVATVQTLLRYLGQEPIPVELFGSFLAITGFVMGFRLIKQQNRYQEIEADVHAVENFGAGLEDLSSALRKLDQMNGLSSTKKDPHAKASLSGHPPTEERIAIIRMILAKNAVYRDKKAAADESQKKAA